MYRFFFFLVAVMVAFNSYGDDEAGADPRNIANGIEIYEHGYCDQPYVVVMPDGAWVCVFTTSAAREGATSQYIVCTRSTNLGMTWTDPLPIESSDGPEASWGMPLLTDFGRIYVFYSYNGDVIRELPNGKKARADMLGWYCYRYSDDGGKTWSERFRLPLRETACDRGNDWVGKVQIFWGIGEPVTWKNHMWFGFTKLGRYMLDDGEGWFFHSDNILSEKDVSKVHFEMLPEGDHGLRAPRFGSVQEEQNLVSLDNGDLYCMYRTTMGWPVNAYSRDGGRTWTEPTEARYADGRIIRHPRACPRVWKTRNGKYLFWCHNHGGRDFSSRNPAWICGGIEQDGFIQWSQPEILLYGHDHSDHTGRFSYPDLIEEDGFYWVTTTQKTRASIHEVEAAFFETLWNQADLREVAQEGLAIAIDQPAGAISMPVLPDLEDGGFTLEFSLTLNSFTPDQILIDTRDETGKGMLVAIAEKETLALTLSDGENSVTHRCDEGMLRPGNRHHVGIVVDGGPNIITWVIDGMVCDGNGIRQYGWGRFPMELGDVNGGTKMRIVEPPGGELHYLRLYTRYLLNSEIIGNYRAGGQVPPRILTDSAEWFTRQKIRIDDPLGGRELYYTLDGSVPDPESKRYTAPFEILLDCRLRVAAVDPESRKVTGTAMAAFKHSDVRETENRKDTAPGLQYRYFEGEWKAVPDMAALTPVKEGIAETLSLSVAERKEDYILEFSGYLNIPETGRWNFRLKSDDGSRLYIGDSLVIDHDGIHGNTEKTGNIALKKGLHMVTVQYLQGKNHAALALMWEGPDTPPDAIPPEAFSYAVR